MSRQYDWQQRKKRTGACQQCGGRPALFFTSLCVPCGIAKRQEVRRRRSCKQRTEGGTGRPWKGTD